MTKIHIESRSNAGYKWLLLIFALVISVGWSICFWELVKGKASNETGLVAVMGLLFIPILLLPLIYRWNAKLVVEESQITFSSLRETSVTDFSKAKYYLIWSRQFRMNPTGWDSLIFFDEKKEAIGSVPWFWERDWEIEQFLSTKLKIYPDSWPKIL